MSTVETGALEDVMSRGSLGHEHALANNTDDADGSQDASDVGDDAHDIMVLALRSQIREALQEEHQHEIAKVKEVYEVELGELRADLITLQQFESKQLERQKARIHLIACGWLICDVELLLTVGIAAEAGWPVHARVP